MILKKDVIISLCPNAGFSLDQNGKIIDWYNKDIKKPTEEEIDAKFTELQAEYDANEYQRQRAGEYPSWQDQLDKIYHDGIIAWQNEIKAIKDKYPKS